MNKQKKVRLCIFFWFFLAIAFWSSIEAQNLNNRVTAEYLEKHLSANTPRLILTAGRERDLKEKLDTDHLVQRYYNYLQKEALRIMTEPLLERRLTGFRLLSVSREFLQRIGTLGMVYRIKRDVKILDRINEEILAVSAFVDWNPQHFLDVAEMSLGMSLALDWVGDDLPESTVLRAKEDLIEKAIKPSFNEGGKRMFWINSTNNWNAVCHGGMIAASLAIADIDPGLAAKTISRALKKLPNSLREYAPDGIYPEGPTYWGYGTSYSVIAAEVLTTALGSDFGIADSPGFLESPKFRSMVTAPSGSFFNFADSGDKNNGSGSLLMCWFAAKTGDGLFFDQSFFENPSDAGRFSGPGLIWLSQFEEKKSSVLPRAWKGDGTNPVAVFRSGDRDDDQFFLAVKGGKAKLSHGNMDAGTFVFEQDGIRWILDPGNQSYYPLNKIGFQLSNHNQESERWTLLTKSNHGHSTVTVNNARFNVNGFAPIVDFYKGEQPHVSIDMTELFSGNIQSLIRTFVKESNKSLSVTDKFVINDSTKNITWGIMTTADVLPVENGAILIKDGRHLNLSIKKPEGLSVSVISLDPPPLKIDKTIENLKRIEIRIPAYLIDSEEGVLQVRLSLE